MGLKLAPVPGWTASSPHLSSTSGRSLDIRSGIKSPSRREPSGSWKIQAVEKKCIAIAIKMPDHTKVAVLHFKASPLFRLHGDLIRELEKVIHYHLDFLFVNWVENALTSSQCHMICIFLLQNCTWPLRNLLCPVLLLLQVEFGNPPTRLGIV